MLGFVYLFSFVDVVCSTGVKFRASHILGKYFPRGYTTSPKMIASNKLGACHTQTSFSLSLFLPYVFFMLKLKKPVLLISYKLGPQHLL